jgi:hypothetical protein
MHSNDICRGALNAAPIKTLSKTNLNPRDLFANARVSVLSLKHKKMGKHCRELSKQMGRFACCQSANSKHHTPALDQFFGG